MESRCCYQTGRDTMTGGGTLTDSPTLFPPAVVSACCIGFFLTNLLAVLVSGPEGRLATEGKKSEMECAWLLTFPVS